MLRKLSKQKRIGVICELIGFAVLILAAVLLPFRPAGSWKYVLFPIAAVLILLPIPVMWKDGLQARRQQPQLTTHWHRMRQSGFFDLLVLLTAIALVLCLCWGFRDHQLSRDPAQACALGRDGATLEEARLMPDFIEYNFKQDLNLLAANYTAPSAYRPGDRWRSSWSVGFICVLSRPL